MWRGQSLLTEEREGWKDAGYCKKKILRRKFKQLFISALRNDKSTQTSGSVFAERIENVQKTTFELELTEIVDCFLDSHEYYDSDSVSFKIKSL